MGAWTGRDAEEKHIWLGRKKEKNRIEKRAENTFPLAELKDVEGLFQNGVLFIRIQQ